MATEEVEVPKKRLIIVGLTDCAPCVELEKQVKSDDVSKALLEKHGVDGKQVKVMYADKDGKEGDEARNICHSINHYSSPMLVIERDMPDGQRMFCKLTEDLEEEDCSLYEELPQ
jgi:hypothetical protein